MLPGGELEQLRVCENLSDHLSGNVYAKFREEEDAEKALTQLMGRFYAGRPILAQVLSTSLTCSRHFSGTSFSRPKHVLGTWSWQLTRSTRPVRSSAL